MAGNFDSIIREVLNSTQTKPAQNVGDVVEMPPTRPSLETYPPAGEPRSWSPYMQNYDYRWDQILHPSIPANDASIASAILRS